MGYIGVINNKMGSSSKNRDKEKAKGKKITVRQKRTIRSLLTRLGYTIDYANILLTQKMAEGEWSDRDYVQNVVIPQLQKDVLAYEVITDTEKRRKLLAKMNTDLSVFRKGVFVRHKETSRKFQIEEEQNGEVVSDCKGG